MIFTFLCISFGCSFLLVSGFYLVKLIDLLEKRRKEKYKSVKSEFLSDLYTMQQKWARRGEFAYSKAFGLMIEPFAFQDEPETPVTDYGKGVAKQMEFLAMQKAVDDISKESEEI